MKKVIAISGINATDNPGPGVAVAKSIKESDPEITLIGLSYDIHDPGNYMCDLFANCFLLPYPTKGWESFVGAISLVKQKTGLDIIIPCLDAELPLLIKHEKDLLRMGIKMMLPAETQFDLRSKDQLTGLAPKIGCLYPTTKVVYSLDEIVSTLRKEISLPAVVKGKYYKAYTVYNQDTAILKGSEIAAEWGFPLLVQERVEGQEINLIGLGDGKGGILGRVSIKKQLTTQLGKVWTAVTIKDDRLDAVCDKFCAETKWNGPFELECMSSSKGIYLIEINPRFPAWVYFATAVGVNLPKLLVQHLLEQNPQAQMHYETGKYLVRQTSEFVTDIRYFQNLLTQKNREGA